MIHKKMRETCRVKTLFCHVDCYVCIFKHQYILETTVLAPAIGMMYQCLTL